MPEEDVTQVLQRWQAGDGAALDDLLRRVYPELRRLAARHMRAERSGHTLQPTALVHEVYLRMIDQQRVSWQNRAHFLAVAARLTRRVLIDHARKRVASKRRLGATALPIDEVEIAAHEPRAADLADLDEALEALAAIDARAAQVVELRFFGGLSVDEVAAVLAVSTGTVKRDWVMARRWLRDRVGP
jgi:RNA polymerase sigma-70 factor (ECF subfamily)